MLKNINPTQTQAWKALTAHFESAQDMDLKELFAQDAARFDKYSARFGSDILVDYSKNLINEETLKHLSLLRTRLSLSQLLKRCSVVMRSTKQKIALFFTLHYVTVRTSL